MVPIYLEPLFVIRHVHILEIDFATHLKVFIYPFRRQICTFWSVIDGEKGIQLTKFNVIL